MQTTEEVYSSLDEFVKMAPTLLNEKQRRLVLGKISDAYGYGGMVRIQSLTGISLPTLRKGKAEADAFIANISIENTEAPEQIGTQEDQPCEAISGEKESNVEVDQDIYYHKTPKRNIPIGENQNDATNHAPSSENSTEKEKKNGKIEEIKIRGPGGGRKPLTEKYPGIKEEIKKLIDGKEYGSPTKVLHWVPQSMSLRKIAIELGKKGFKCSHETVSKLLEDMGYSKQVNQKMLQVGEPHPDRDAQFQFINDTAVEFLKAGDPVISVDSKKKENVGNFKNDGQVYRPIRDPILVKDHDYPTEDGKVTPYGIYLVNNNTGFVNLGIDHDTAEFAIESILRWWNTIGKGTFPSTKRLYITCDGGGSNSSRCRLWKCQLQVFCNVTGLEVTVSHYPPGNSKWNKIEHRLFCYISKNWQGIPLADIETVIELISNTTTTKGLTVRCALDENVYSKGIKVTDEEFENIALYPCEKFGKWNYTIKPQT